jgi:O-antigen/teichoic acid export membrane protein
MPPGYKNRSVLNSISGTIVSNVMGFFLGIISSVVLNRSLGPSGKGVYVVLTAVSGYVALLATLGIGKSATYFMANSGTDPKKAFRVLATLSYTSVFVTVVMIFAFKEFLAKNFVMTVLQEPMLPLLILTVSMLLYGNASGVLRGLKSFRELNIYNVLQNIFFLATLMLLAISPGLSASTAIYSRATSFLALIFILVVRLIKFGFDFVPAYDRKVAAGILTYGLGYFAYALLQNLNYRFDVMLLASLTNNASVGWYSTGVGLAEMIWYLPTAVGMVLFPVVAGMEGRDGDLLVARACRWSLLLMVCGVIFLLPVAPLLVTILYGEDFLPAVPVLYALSIGIVANGLFQVLGIYLASRKMMSNLTFLTLVGFVTNLFFNLILIPRLGIVGAGLSSTISYSVAGLLTARVFYRTTGISWLEFLLIRREDLTTIRLMIGKKWQK